MRVPTHQVSTSNAPGPLALLFALTAMFLFSGALVALLRTQAGFEYDVQEGDRVLQAAFALIYIIAGAALVSGGGLVRLRRLRARLAREGARPQSRGEGVEQFAPALIWTLIGFAAVSTLWSADRMVTMRSVIGLAGATIFATYFGKTFGVTGVLKTTAMALAVALLLSFAFVLLMPDVAVMSGQHEGAWNGVFTHKNHLGNISALAIVLVVGLVGLEVLKPYLLLLCLPVTLLMVAARSATPVASLAVAVGSVVVLRSTSRGSTQAFAAGAGTAAVLALTLTSLPLELLNRDATLTGRSEIWGASLPAIGQRLLVGHGYRAFWGVTDHATDTLPETVGWTPRDAHNGYVDLLLETGVVGVALWVGILVTLILVARAQHGRGATVSTITVYVAFYNLGESATIRPNNLLWVLTVALLTALTVPHQRGPDLQHEPSSRWARAR